MSIFTRLLKYLTRDVAMMTASHEIAHALIVKYYGEQVHDVVIGVLGRGGYCTFDLPGAIKHQLVVFAAGYVQECILKGKLPSTYVHGSGTDGDAMQIHELVGRKSWDEEVAIGRAYSLLTMPGVQEYIKDKAVILVETKRITGDAIKYSGYK